MLVVYRRSNWDIIRIENAAVISFVELEKYIDLYKRKMEITSEVRKDLSKRSEVLSDITFDIFKRVVRVYTQDLIHYKLGYRYVFYIDTSSGESYSLYTKQAGKEEYIERLINNKPIEYILIDEDKGIIDMK